MRSTAYRWVAAIPLSLSIYKAGDRTMGGTMRAADRGYGALRAIDPVSGEQKGELASSMIGARQYVIVPAGRCSRRSLSLNVELSTHT